MRPTKMPHSATEIDHNLPCAYRVEGTAPYSLSAFSILSWVNLPLPTTFSFQTGMSVPCTRYGYVLALVKANRVELTSGRAPPAGPSGSASGGAASPVDGRRWLRLCRDRAPVRTQFPCFWRNQDSLSWLVLPVPSLNNSLASCTPNVMSSSGETEVLKMPFLPPYCIIRKHPSFARDRTHT